MSIVVVFLLILSAALAFMIMTKRLKFPLLMECGMFSVSLGMLAAADAIHSETTCTPFGLMLRWGLVGVGFGMMILSLLLKSRKTSGGFRRFSDYVEMAEKDMRKASGGKQ